MSINIVIPKYEFEFDKNNTKLIKQIGGIYCFYGKENDLLYIGKAADLRNRIRGHFAGTTSLKDVYHNFNKVKGFYCSNPVEREIYETYLINELQPKLNLDKVFTYTSSRFEEMYQNNKTLQRDIDIEESIKLAMENFKI